MPTLIQEKVQQAVGILREQDVDCWLTFTRETQLNGDPTLPFLANAALTWHSALIVCASGKTVAIVGAYDKQTVEETGAYGEVIGYVEGIKVGLQATLAAIAPRSIAINYSQESEVCDGLTHGMYLTLCELLAAIDYQDRLVSAERIVSALRQRKTPSELERVRAAVRAAEAIFGKVARFIGPGQTEREVAAFMQRAVQSAGLELAWEAKTCPSVFSGPETAGAHYAPTERTVERGHVLNMDFGVKVDGYCSDLQRTFYVRNADERDAPPDVRKGFDTIASAIESARLALRPGVVGQAIDAIARGVLAAAGYAAFPHGLGHQVGRSAHDGTALLGPAWEKYAGKPFVPIEAGMVFTLEPRLTVPGRGVVTIEEMVVVTDDGAEYLSTPQRELWMVG
jgi:Xaa-Pro aminopeptidase